MMPTILLLLGLVAVFVFVNWVNRRHDARKHEAEAASNSVDTDLHVAEAWDAFGLDDDIDHQTDRLESLLATAPVHTLREKKSLVRVALMSLRAGQTPVLRSVVQRASEISSACGETAAMQGLHLAYNGDPVLAHVMLSRARATLSGCGTCGSSVESQLLVQECAIAMDQLAQPNDASSTNALEEQVVDVSDGRVVST